MLRVVATPGLDGAAHRPVSRALERFRREGATAEPVIFGAHRKPEAVVIPFALYEQLVAAPAARRRAVAAASASLLAELPGEFDAEDEADVQQWVEGEMSADDLYARALARSGSEPDPGLRADPPSGPDRRAGGARARLMR